ncbi:MAG: Nramp family divalent metal transporter [Verrucomicrobia bacterium]|nr:Nramp family divalent metal transporter [Verrucomicrobiota bacterium]MDA1067988.1 Nramp family divalent metal transporter [Verrucomicrobiota bacterium]
MPDSKLRNAPTSIIGTLKELGPGLIIAGGIVGSGELIATTATGAEAGFWLLWIIIVGCVIKVFVQLEIGRYVILTGKTTLQGINGLPGLKIKGAHWIAWFWLAMFITSTAQQGGIVAGVGQALSISVPLTETGAAFNEAAEEQVLAKLALASGEISAEETRAIATKLPDAGYDIYIWAILVTLLTSAILFWGRYGAIETVVTSFVAFFTLITLINLVLLQMNPEWAVSWESLKQGMSFRLPPFTEGINPIVTALATFGIIGVGAGELVYYPYWCLEKGYASFIGKREDTDAWNHRARGWLRVMKWDAWLSLIVYTSSTVVFYILGAAVLHRANLHPQGMEMIRTLAAMYEPVFGSWAVGLFLVGAIAVLYSTFFVVGASKARVFADAMVIFGWRESTPEKNHTWVRWLCLAFPIIGFLFFWLYPKPKELVLLAGTMQAFLLPMLAFSAIYFRYKFAIPALRPTKIYDLFLWISAIGMLIAGLWLAWSKLAPAFS